LPRNALVSLNQERVVTLNRNQMVRLSEISNLPYVFNLSQAEAQQPLLPVSDNYLLLLLVYASYFVILGEG